MIRMLITATALGDKSWSEHLRSQRTQTTAQVDRAARIHTAKYGTISGNTQHAEHAPASH